jgi:hypothetical protein
MTKDEHLGIINSSYPRIYKALALFWGEREFIPYVEKLLSDTRDGDRAGFPSNIADSFVELQNMHNKEFPQFETQWGNVWLKTHFGKV